MNFDGYSLGDMGQFGIGWVIRYHQGSIIKAYSKLAGKSFAIEAEVVTLLEGLMQTKALGLSKFVVEGDSISHLMGG